MITDIWYRWWLQNQLWPQFCNMMVNNVEKKKKRKCLCFLTLSYNLRSKLKINLITVDSTRNFFDKQSSPVITVKQASETTSAALRVKNKSLLWYPFRCVEWKVTSVTAAEFCGAVILSDLHVPVNSAVAHSKNTRLEQFEINYCLNPLWADQVQ